MWQWTLSAFTLPFRRPARLKGERVERGFRLGETAGIILITIEQMFVLFVVACIGFFCAKRDIITTEVRGKLSRLLTEITLPCMLVASVGDAQPGEAGAGIGLTFGLAVAQGFLLYGSAWLCNLVLRTPKADRPLYYFMSLATNTGFIGLPVVSAIYGPDAVIFVSVFIMVLSVFTFSLGFATIAPRVPGEKFRLPWDKMLNPPLIGSVITVVLFLSPFRLPAVVQDSFTTIGSVTSPLAMMIVGAIVSEMPAREIFSDWRLYGYSLIRMLIIPCALYLVLEPFVQNPLLMGVFCVLFAMPVGSMASMFALQLGANDRLAARGTVLTSILSFVLTPLLVAFMALVG